MDYIYQNTSESVDLDVIYHNIYHFQDLILISILIGLGQSS